MCVCVWQYIRLVKCSMHFIKENPQCTGFVILISPVQMADTRIPIPVHRPGGNSTSASTQSTSTVSLFPFIPLCDCYHRLVVWPLKWTGYLGRQQPILIIKQSLCRIPWLLMTVANWWALSGTLFILTWLCLVRVGAVFMCDWQRLR